MLPLLPLPTGIVLQGVARRGGRASADEDAGHGESGHGRLLE